jgi:hypothetical protein
MPRPTTSVARPYANNKLGRCNEKGENDMKTTKVPSQKLPPHDYRPALQGALTWLGKRYLLAEPLNRRSDDRKPDVTELQRA